MSFYNLLFGKNPSAEIILALLGFKENDVERFRDVSINENGIEIYTRTGGGNRDDYPNEKLTSHPCYLNDEDDEFDSTYATFYFKFPDEIKDDCLLFLDAPNNGIPASIIKKVIETSSRPETEGDKRSRIYKEQESLYRDLRFNHKVIESNGHTIVPLSDEAMEKLLESAEKNDGQFIPYSIKPYKIKIRTEVPRWSFDSEKEKLCRVLIEFDNPWTVDEVIWKRYRDKFETKYPKAIANILKYIK